MIIIFGQSFFLVHISTFQIETTFEMIPFLGDLSDTSLQNEALIITKLLAL